jgi:hypothetical protein
MRMGGGDSLTGWGISWQLRYDRRMNRVILVCCVAIAAVGCGKKDAAPAADTGKAGAKKSPPAADKPVAKPASVVKQAVPKSAADAAPKPPVDAAPKPFILTEKQCRAASARSYALMQRWNPKKLSKKQKKQVDDYAAQMEGISLTNCRRNLRAWYDCKMAAKKHFESEDCNMIGADDSDGDPP